MKPTFVATLFMLALSISTHSLADGFVDGNKLQANYQTWKSAIDNAGGKTPDTSAINAFISGAYIGYVASVADTYASTSECFKAYSLKNKLSINDFGLIVGKFLAVGGIDLSSPASTIVFEALMRKSNCLKF